MHIPPPFLFSIDCSIREWNTPSDAKEPCEPAVIHEARCIPGNLIGCGATRQDAVASLVRLIEWTLHEERAPIAWYKRAWEKASFEDQSAFGVRAVEIARNISPVPPRRVRESVRYSTLDPVPC